MIGLEMRWTRRITLLDTEKPGSISGQTYRINPVNKHHETKTFPNQNGVLTDVLASVTNNLLTHSTRRFNFTIVSASVLSGQWSDWLEKLAGTRLMYGRRRLGLDLLYDSKQCDRE